MVSTPFNENTVSQHHIKNRRKPLHLKLTDEVALVIEKDELRVI